MSLTLYFALLLLAPVFFALVIAALGFARQTIPWLVGVCAALGVALPLVGLIILNIANSSGVPLQITLLGEAGQKVPFAVAFRLDTIGYYAAYGLLVAVTPLLLWLAWRGRFSAAPDVIGESAETAATPEDAIVEAAEEIAEEAPQDTGDTVLERPALATEQWAGAALALGLLSAAFSLVFADNIIWLGVSWIAVAALAWALGELGSEPSGLDWLSLILMVAGPILWLGAMYLAANPTGFTRISDLMGLGTIGAGNALLVIATVAIAAGAWPLNGWVRRRAIVSPPVGVAAVALVALPIALFAGARTYSALQNAVSLLPTIGTVTPPITVGLLWVILGALTLAICGLQALGRRDARSLIAFLALAQVGWGLIALGVSRPAGILGVVVLLATMVFGLAAMITASVVGGTLAPDVEADGAGPHPFGFDLRPANVAVWIAGALSLIGAPLLGGFVAQQMIATGAVRAAQIIIPLVGLGWAGDALLAIALLRAVAPAFAAARTSHAAEAAVAVAESDALLAVDEGDDESVAVEEKIIAEEPTAQPALVTWDEAPGIVFALLATLIGAVPSLLLSFGALAAAESLTQSLAVSTALTYGPTGYTLAPGQWLPGLVWIAALILGAIMAIPLLRARMRAGETYLGGQSAVEAIDATRFAEIASLAEPDAAWSDLRAAMDSGWTTPGRGRILDELEGASDAEEDGVEVEVTTEKRADETDDTANDTNVSRERVSKAGEQ
ncbi:MAG TPA: proton-conducting transporter membrane subunit [Ktedonobacterales bacterium]|nr:proton-conducting transporter membrane subunit [Ktedonobacterales bacterium]